MTTFPADTASEGGVVVVRPAGRLNMTIAPELRQQLQDLIQNGNNRLVVDMAAVPLIDSAGLGALISGLKAARQAGGDLRILAPSKQVLHVLDLAHLSQVLPIYESADNAFPD